MELQSPSPQYRRSYLEELKEFNREDSLHYNKLDYQEIASHFADYTHTLIEQSQGQSLPAGYVPATELWLIDQGEFIGHVSIRHYLNQNLATHGGHLGYYVRPSKRRLGYGSRLLSLALTVVKSMGITKALLTCDDDNLPSIRIIELHGGQLIDIIPQESRPTLLRRYRIPLQSN
jgi:predicted acetyltransferase